MCRGIKKMKILKTCCIPFLCSIVFSGMACASDLENAIRETYSACVVVNKALSELKSVAVTNTAVSGVGTVAGGAATAVGIAKEKHDSVRLDKLRQIQENNAGTETSEMDANAFLAAIANAKYQQTKLKPDEKSKKLGNWRTGLLGLGTATNIASTVMAKNIVDNSRLETAINNCIASVDRLKNIKNQAHIDGLDTSQADTIISECEKYKYVDITPITKRARGAMVSSFAGGITGGAGTVVSAMANSSDAVTDGIKREENLNKSANVLAGVSGVASGVATVFNASQISIINKISDIAENCLGVLK